MIPIGTKGAFESESDFVFNRARCAHFVFSTSSLLHVSSRQRLIFYRLIDRVKADDTVEKFSTQKVDLCNSAKFSCNKLGEDGRQETVKKLELRYYSKESHGYATQFLNREISEISFYLRRKCEGKDVKEK